jgi:hypothetical protein
MDFLGAPNETKKSLTLRSKIMAKRKTLQEKIGSLSRVPLMAYVVRCARRFQPYCDKSPLDLIKAFDDGLNAASELVASESPIASSAFSHASMIILGSGESTSHELGLMRSAFAAIRGCLVQDRKGASSLALKFAEDVHELFGSDFQIASEADLRKLGRRRAPFDPSEHGPIGDFWHGDPPISFVEAKHTLDLTQASIAKSAHDPDIESGPRSERNELKKEVGTLKTQLRERGERYESKAKIQDRELENLRATNVDQKANLRDLEYKYRETQRRLSYREPFRWKDITELLTKENVLLVIVLGLMIVAVCLAMAAITEIQSRQQLVAIIESRLDATQRRIVALSRSESSADADNVFSEDQNRPYRELQMLHKLRVDADLLVASGAKTGRDTIDGVRGRLLAIDEQDAETDEAPDGGIGGLLTIRFYSSDLLLSFVVITAGCIGAILAAMRSQNVFTLRDLGLGLGAGFITFLVIRSGKSIFLLDPGGPIFVLNPYTSAFFGLAAGLFTERAYQLFTELLDEMIRRLRNAFIDVERSPGLEPDSSLQGNPQETSDLPDGFRSV